MLVLRRKKNESIAIGDDIIITVSDIIGDTIRLCIAAPNEIPVYRYELYDTLKRSHDADTD